MPGPFCRLVLLAAVAASLVAGVRAQGREASPVAEGPGPGTTLTAPLLLDAGEGGAANPGAGERRLGRASAFDPALGFGWRVAPTAVFGDSAWTNLRPPALTDGLSGPRFSLGLHLGPGAWTAMVYLDDGYRDAHEVRIAVDGEVRAHSPRRFGREAEAGSGPINRIRVVQLALRGGGSTTLGFSGSGAGDARLLAVRLLPEPATDGSDETAAWLRAQLAEVGRHGSRASFDPLRAALRQFAEEPARAAFCAYWLAQLDLLASAERWHGAGGWDHVSVETRSSMFTRYHLALSLLDPLVEHPDGPAFPLRPRALWLRARLLYWLWMEQAFDADRAAFERDVEEVRRSQPGDRLVSMYAGEQIDEPDPLDRYRAPANAPAWSVAQFEAIQRLRDVAHYWIDERQAANGEFGGKPDDDVETLRWWPALMFTGDRKTVEGFARLAEGVWFSRRMERGYSREPRDVEHSAEFVADTVPMIAFLSRDPVWFDRLAWSHRHMRDLWTGRNDHGDLQFKSAWIGATEILSAPPRNRDLAMNARATKAVRWLAWLRRDAGADDLLADWSRTWAKAARRTDKGKPFGLFPASLRWPDAAITGDEPSWHRANMFWDYFDWSGEGLLYDQLLFSWVRSGDGALLEPMTATLAFLAAHETAAGADAPAEGSAAWAARALFANPEFWGVVAQWRLETGDDRHDALLQRRGPPYLRFRLGQGPEPLAAELTASLLETLRYNRPMRTTEVLFTDRIRVTRKTDTGDGIDLLVAMLTGNHSPRGMSPFYHVAWEGAAETLTALVTEAGPRAFAAEVFLHQDAPAEVVTRLFRLTPGRYRLTVNAGGRILTERVEAVGPDHRLQVRLPGGEIVRLRLSAE